MTPKLIRTAALAGLLLATSAPGASGATQKEIDQALKAGAAALKARYARPAGGPGVAPGLGAGGTEANAGIGATALAGLAILEAGTPANDPAVKAITEHVRNEAYRQVSTYQIALCLMYLDRFGDPADETLIQILGVRLLVGQTAGGGWGYQCLAGITPEDDKWLRAIKADRPAGKLHPDVEKYGQALAAARAQNAGTYSGDDNSNTQFAVMAVWMARKHGVPVETALDAIEKRFVNTQDQRTGHWAYSGGVPNAGAPGALSAGSPSMYCAGLLGMATAVARREERRKNEAPTAKPELKPKADGKPNDPFYNPPAPKTEPKKADPAAARPADARDLVVQRAFAGLGLYLVDQIRNGRGLLAPNSSGHGYNDLYFLWSLERAGVVYGMDKIGGIDWYDVGATALVRSQGPDGTWSVGSYGTEVNTAFAVLFLSRSNLARDLSSKVQKDPTSTEMRAGSGPSANELLPNRPAAPAAPAVPTINLPNPTGDEAITLAGKMLKAPDTDWAKLLVEARDAKGPTYTRALVVTATHTEGGRKKAAREMLAERLCRMNAATLRGMLKADAAELRRAAALACAMKDEKEHVPDLIEALTDPDDTVTRAAKAGLKSLTGKDFGPVASPTAEQKTEAQAAWKEWYAKEKK